MKNKSLEKDINYLISNSVVFKKSDTTNRFGIFGYNPEDETRTFFYLYDNQEDRDNDLENYNKNLVD